jgi:TolA-binding protein
VMPKQAEPVQLPSQEEEAVTPTQPVPVQSVTPSPQPASTQPMPVEGQEETPPTQPVPAQPAELPSEVVEPGEDVQGLLQQGISQVKGPEIVQGMEKLRRVVQLDPDNANAWLWLGWAAAQQKDLRAADSCFRRAQKLGHPKAEDGLKWLSKKRG